jgi:hypothetical protein
MELWFLHTVLPLNLLDHCMKLYWISTVSLQVMLQTRKNQWTARPADHWMTPFRGIIKLVELFRQYYWIQIFQVMYDALLTLELFYKNTDHIWFVFNFSSSLYDILAIFVFLLVTESHVKFHSVVTLLYHISHSNLIYWCQI